VADLRSVIRRLRRRPVATVLTILTLALAIGVAAAVFSIVDQLILRPPPFLHADRLVNVLGQPGPNRPGGPLTPGKVLGWQEQPAVFERLEAYAGASFDLTGSIEPQRVAARIVSLGLFDMLGIKTHIGRPFAPGDGAPNSEKVVILSYEFWKARCSGSPAVLGSTIELNDERHTIVGVLSPGTTLLTGEEPVWLPYDLKAWSAGTSEYRFFGIGRLNAALDITQARTTADAIAVTLGQSMPLRQSWYLGIERKRSAQLTTTARQTLFVLLGAVTLLLLIACVNVTSFALGQALDRERELRLRAAIGAGTWRLLRECLVETLLLAATAGLMAVVIARVALAALLAAAPNGLAFMTTRAAELDIRVFAVMAITTLTVGLLAGLLSGFRSSRLALSGALSDATRGVQRGRSFGGSRGGLVVVEVALATILLVGSALMSRTLIRYYALAPGFDVGTLTTVEIALPSHRYPNEQARREFFGRLDAALRRQPGIEASAYAWGIPPGAGSWSARRLQAEGREPAAGSLEFFANAVSPTYFETTGTPLLAGRTFTPDDADDAVIVSHAFARMLWGDEPAVGRRLRESPADQWLTVVGVAGNVESYRQADQRSDLQMYVPLALSRAAAAPVATGRSRSYVRQLLIVRASDARSVHAAIRQQVHLLDPTQPVGTFVSGAELYGKPFAQQHFLLTVMSVLAAVALLLAAMGIFGILSQAVTQRRREIGIRIALGSGSPRLIRLLVGQGVGLAAAGVGVGAVASLFGVRALEALLVGVTPFDAVSFLVVAVVTLVVALMACWWPTARALAVDPAEVLKSEP
jgi:putative ABC transport system permease protein